MRSARARFFIVVVNDVSLSISPSLAFPRREIPSVKISDGGLEARKIRGNETRERGGWEGRRGGTRCE